MTGPIVCRKCGQPMNLLDEEEQRWYCFKDDLLYVGKDQHWSDEIRSSVTPVQIASGPPPPPVETYDVWIPIIWLAGILVTGFANGLIGILVLIAGAIYVHYNSRKFKVGGSRAIITLLFAIVGLPLYSWDLYKLKHQQETSKPTLSTEQPTAPPLGAQSTPPTKFCRECGAKVPRESKFCEVCGTKLAG